MTGNLFACGKTTMLHALVQREIAMYSCSFKTIFMALLVSVGLVAQLPAFAQSSSSSADNEHEVKFVTLGTIAGPVPTPDRTQTSNLLIVNGTDYLIDAGANVTRRIAQAGEAIPDVGRIFFTHEHSDHTMGLPFLLSASWYYGRANPIQIYGPKGTNALVKAALDYDSIDADIRHGAQTESIYDTVEVHEVKPGQFYSDDNIIVKAVENTHFHFKKGDPAYGKFASYSYRFDTKNGPSIVVTGDTGPSVNVLKLAQGADVLVSETLAINEIRERRKKAGTWQTLSDAEQRKWTAHMLDEHITPAQAGKLAAKAGVKLLILSHLSSGGKRGDDYQRFVKKAGEYYDGPIVAAKDLMEFDLLKPGGNPHVIDYMAR